MQHVYKVTTKYSDLFPVLEHCSVRETRRDLYNAYHSRAIDINPKLLTEIVSLRQELAEILGYKNYVHYAASLGMQDSDVVIQEFLVDMNSRFNASNIKDMAYLTKLAREDTGDEHFELALWDRNFYIRQLKERELSINMQEVQKYFPCSHVIEETMKIYENILGLNFVRTDTSTVWHEDVIYYRVYDQGKGGREVGAFYLDLHPRDGKYCHAAVFELNFGCDKTKLGVGDGRVQTQVAMLCNFPKTGTLPHGDFP